MSWQRSLQSAVRELKKEETALERQLEQLRTKIEELETMSRTGVKRATPKRKSGKGRKRLSPAGRAAISKAAKKRWARYRAQQRNRS